MGALVIGGFAAAVAARSSGPPDRLAASGCLGPAICDPPCLLGVHSAQQVDEVFAVVGPGHLRAEAAARRNGMEWVCVTDKYFGVTLHVYRLRPADLERSAQQNQLHRRPAREPSWARTNDDTVCAAG